MNLSSMYQIIAEENFPEIRQLWTALTWNISGYEIVEMKIHEEKFDEWERRINSEDSLFASARWMEENQALKTVVFDYGGLSVLNSLSLILANSGKVDFSTKTIWTDRILERARKVGKNPSIVIVDEWLGGRRYRRNFWRWQPVELTEPATEQLFIRQNPAVKQAFADIAQLPEPAGR